MNESLETLLRAFVCSQLYDQLSVFVAPDTEREWARRLGQMASDLTGIEITPEVDVLLDRHPKKGEEIVPLASDEGLERALWLALLAALSRMADKEAALKIRQLAADSMQGLLEPEST